MTSTALEKKKKKDKKIKELTKIDSITLNMNDIELKGTLEENAEQMKNLLSGSEAVLPSLF
jgi:hypothetical protein